MMNLAKSIVVILVLTSQTVYGADSCQAIFGHVGKLRQSKTAETDLYFSDKAGKVEEHSIRQGDTAAHIYLDSNTDKNPYLFVGFPAGNSGVAFWFKTPNGAHIEASSKPVAVEREGGLNGVEVSLKTGIKELQIDDSLLGSMRFIRDRELGKNILSQSLGKFADRITRNKVILKDGKLYHARTSLNRKVRYLSEIEAVDGTKIVHSDGVYRLVSNTEVRFKLKAMTTEKPLTPIPMKELFKDEALAKMDQKRLVAFSFLAYKEKLMAGSPRYFSKFGRDSIYVTSVLADFLRPKALEDLLTATISSIDPRTGQVSHEQHESDFVSFVLMKSKKKYVGVDRVIEDTKMVDDNLAATILLTRFLKENPERAESFLNRKEARGINQRDLISKLFRVVERQAESFARAVEAGVETSQLHKHLVALHHVTGQWRDSEAGIGFGIYAFDVNAAFMPGAIKGLAELSASSHPKNEFYNLKRSARYNDVFKIWNTKVTPLFEVTKSKDELYEAAKQFFVNTHRDLRDLPAPPTKDITFHAVSLDKNGKPVPIMHSDDSLLMTFGHPSAAHLRTTSDLVRLPFPYGLRTELGILVANPIFASKELQIAFGDDRYHGTVIWTMQEDLMIFGMAKQFKRKEIPPELKAALRKDIATMERLIKDRGDLGGIEVFSLAREDGKVTPKPFAGDAKGNSNQLWGHLRLVFPQISLDTN